VLLCLCFYANATILITIVIIIIIIIIMTIFIVVVILLHFQIPQTVFFVVGWCIAFVAAFSPLYGVYKVVKIHPESFTEAENIIYATFSRFSWAVALAWVIYACHTGYGGEHGLQSYTHTHISTICASDSFTITSCLKE